MHTVNSKKKHVCNYKKPCKSTLYVKDKTKNSFTVKVTLGVKR